MCAAAEVSRHLVDTVAMNESKIRRRWLRVDTKVHVVVSKQDAYPELLEGDWFIRDAIPFLEQDEK